MASMFEQWNDMIKKYDKQLTEFFVTEVDPLIRDFAGIRVRETEYEGPITIRNALEQEAKLVFTESPLPRLNRLHEETIAAGATFTFDLGKTKSFDYLLSVNGGIAKGTICRNSAYIIQPCLDAERGHGSQELIEETPPTRRKTNLLESTPGLSFSFSASGWLFVYQLGCAEALQNHGICKNPYVRVSGASGGALTVATMMYGCDMRFLRDFIKKCAKSVYKDMSQAVQLRRFLLLACKEVVKDGSISHPAFQSGRVEIAVSESAVGEGFGSSLLHGKTHNRRASKFEDSADVVIALLASSTMGISGVPFVWKNEEGQEVKVADGAFTQFMPVIDDNSVKVKPVSDGLNVLGGKADVQPTEWVPGNMGLYPPASSTIDHLYEMGYQDMDAWIQNHLAKRCETCKEGVTVQNEPPVQFTCKDDGLLWFDKVLRTVPVEWKEQMDEKVFKQHADHIPIKKGWMDMEVKLMFKDTSKRSLDGAGAEQKTEQKHGQRWVELSASHFGWREKEEVREVVQQEDNSAEDGFGEIPLQWVERVELDKKDSCVLDIATSDLQTICLKASSQADAQEWLRIFTEARSNLKKAMEAEEATKGKDSGAVNPGDVDAKLVEQPDKKEKPKKQCCLLM